MRTALVDTSYLLALVHTADEHHEAALAAQRDYRGQLVTTDYVLLEVLDALTHGRNRAIGGALVNSLLHDEWVEVVPASRNLLERGFELFQRFGDKEWGLTDGISFVVMNERGLREALTSDHHFEQAGFRALLRE